MPSGWYIYANSISETEYKDNLKLLVGLIHVILRMKRRNLAFDIEIDAWHKCAIVKVECLAEGPNPAESLKRRFTGDRCEIE